MFKAFAIAGFIAAFATGCSGQLSSPGVPSQTASSSISSAIVASSAPQSALFAGSIRQAGSQQAGTVVFSDTFEQDPVNFPAPGWSTLSGLFSVCQPSGKTHEYCQKSAGDASAVPNLAGSASWTDYQLDADLVHGSTAGAVSVLARMKDAGHFYALTIRSNAASSQEIWQLWKYDGRRTEFTGRGLASPVGQTIHVRLVVSGPSISAYAGQSDALNLLATISDSTYASGGIGIRSSGSTSSTFDNVTVSLAGSPHPTPSPSPSSTPPAGGVATYDGCPIFTPGDYYNADITNAAIDTHSADYLASVEAVDNTGFQDSLGIEPVNTAVNNTPLYTVHPKVSWHSFSVQYPWQQGFQIENIGDAHYVAINKDSCHLYEAYGASFNNGVFSAYDGKDYDLHQPFKIGSGVMASGLSYFAGAVRHEEIATGIHHALDIAVWQNALCNCYTAPANSGDGVPYQGAATAYELPYGAQLRLKATYDCSRWGPQSGAICTALKHYGMLMSDTDGHYGNNNKFFFVNPTDGGAWDGGDLGALNSLRFSDFDVLKLGTIKH